MRLKAHQHRPKAGKHKVRIGIAAPWPGLSTTSRSKVRWATTIIALLAFAASLQGALRYPMWLDEVASARIISMHSITGVLGAVRANESTPPLWYVLIWGLAWLGRRAHFVSTVQAWRGLSVACITLSAALLVRFTARFLPLRAGVLAGALVALGSQYVDAGDELRAYALFALLVMLFATALEWAARRPSLGRTAVLSTIVGAGVMTEYFFLLTLAGGALWVLHAQRKLSFTTKVRLLTSLSVGLVPLLLYLPALLAQLHAHHFGFIGVFTTRRYFALWVSLFAEHLSAGSLSADVQLIIFLLIAIGGVRLWKREASRLAFFLLLVPAILALLLWPAGLQIFDARNLLGVGLFAAIAISAAVTTLPRRLSFLGVSAIAITLAGIFATTQLPLRRTPYRKIATTLVRSGWTRSDPVIFFHVPFVDMNPIAWYLPRHPVMKRGRPGPATCPNVFFIVESSAGRKWLSARRSLEVGISYSFPYFGNSPVGRRRAGGVEVGRLRGSPVLLLSAHATAGSLFETEARPLTCLLRSR